MARVRACVERLQHSGNPFYRRLDGIDAASLRSHDDLARLPFTVKADLRDQYPFGMLVAAAPRDRAGPRLQRHDRASRPSSPTPAPTWSCGQTC